MMAALTLPLPLGSDRLVPVFMADVLSFSHWEMTRQFVVDCDGSGLNEPSQKLPPVGGEGVLNVCR